MSEKFGRPGVGMSFSKMSFCKSCRSKIHELVIVNCGLNAMFNQVSIRESCHSKISKYVFLEEVDGSDGFL